MQGSDSFLTTISRRWKEETTLLAENLLGIASSAFWLSSFGCRSFFEPWERNFLLFFQSNMTNEHENRKRPLIEEMSQESQGGSSAGHADGTSTPELFSMPPPTATWADSKDPEQPDSEVSVPAALQFLENNGVSFTLVPRFISSGGHPGIQKK